MTADRTEARTGFAYRPALDGLRTVSVAAVFAYHLNYGWAGGGFLGVDVFFVLSGYLITSLLLSEWTRSHGIDLRAFWARRARRLLPAVFLLLLAVAAYAGVVAPADQLDRLRGDQLATLFYVQNWWLILKGHSYFDLWATPSPLRHAWSLAIEEQFYLLWPLVVFAAMRWRNGSRRTMLATCILGTFASVVWMWLVFDPVDPSRAYYGTGARAHTLLVGSILAVALEGRDEIASRWRRLVDALGATAFTACVACFAFVGDRDPFFYKGGSLLFSLTVAAVITSAVQPGRGPLRRALAFPPLRWLGRISYGVYLWHWPVIVVLTRSRVGLESEALAAFQVATTLLLSIASFVLVERPVRYGALGQRISVGHATTVAAGLAVAILVSTTGGVPPSAMFETPGEAAAVTKTQGGGVAEPPGTSERTLTIGVVGDSVAWSLVQGLTDAAEPLGFKVFNGTVPGCGLAVSFAVNRDGTPFEWSSNCPDLIETRISRLFERAGHLDLVLWLSSWDFADQLVDGRHLRFRTEEGDRALIESMERIVRRFRDHGARVAILTPPERAVSDRAPAGLDSEGLLRHYHKILHQFARERPEDVVLVDLAALLCPDGLPCPELIEGQRLRPDGGHFSREGAFWVGQRVLPTLVAGIR
jgi:peptidoglycan/LPS O-acetylase OafA/YrhL